MNETLPGAGLTILVVDDEAMIAMLVEDMLLDLGCNVLGPASSVAQSIALIEANQRTLGGAFLDINLRGELVYPVADRLAALGVPFVFITGNALYGIDPRFASIPALAKPFSIEALDRTVKDFAKRRLAVIPREVSRAADALRFENTKVTPIQAGRCVGLAKPETVR